MKQRVSLAVCAALACLGGVCMHASLPEARASSGATTGTIVVNITGEIAAGRSFVVVSGPGGMQTQFVLGPTATFSGLEPGTYTVSVAGLNGSGSQTAQVAADATTVVNFVFGTVPPVNPPFPFPFGG